MAACKYYLISENYVALCYSLPWLIFLYRRSEKNSIGVTYSNKQKGVFQSLENYVKEER